MPEVKQKKKHQSAGVKGAATRKEGSPDDNSSVSPLWKSINILLIIAGVVAFLFMGLRFAKHCEEYHEAMLWFSNIEELKREISFRTESGLFYSYYKTMTHKPSIVEGIYELTHDNVTEHGHTMNVLERMNIYQEVLLAIFYKIFNIQMQPVYFYLRSIWFLHAGLLGAVCCITWFLSSSWLAGCLAAAFYLFNMEDTTRVHYTMPLRENFSLPFLWGQLLCITLYFSPSFDKFHYRQLCLKAGIAVCTFFFTLFWQFNQFIMLMQAMALFGVQVLYMVPHKKICFVYVAQLTSLLLVAVLQFGNSMIVGGLPVSFISAALTIMVLQTDRPKADGYLLRILTLGFSIVFVFILMAFYNRLIKMIIHVDSDEHIYKFVLHKFGIAFSRDFDVKLYVCNAAFDFLAPDIIGRLLSKLVLPGYVVYHVLGLGALAVAVLQKWRFEIHQKKDEDHVHHSSKPHTVHMFEKRPELVYHLIQVTFFCCLAITTLRMKYLWTPFICILSALALSDKYCYSYVARKISTTSIEAKVFVIQIVLCGLMLYVAVQKGLPAVKDDLNNLREFYDPDTVELMEWIKKTPPNSAYSGSMQLLAGVKLCTGRAITNHPHYEDKDLRHRTKELYQMYARQDPAEVHRIMNKYGARYIILEDSICLAPPKDNCRLSDLLDIDNGQVPDSGSPRDGLIVSTTPRFCNEVRHMKPPYKKYFKLVFHNKTFRVYEVLKVTE